MREKVFVARVPSYDDPDAIAAAVRRGLEFLGYTPPARLVGAANWVLAHREVARSCYTRPEFLLGALRALLGRNESASIELIGNAGAGVPTRSVARRAAGTSVAFERRGAYELERALPGRVRIRPTDSARLGRYRLSVGPLLDGGERRAIDRGDLDASAVDARKRFWSEVRTSACLADAEGLVLFPKLKSNVLSHGLTGAIKLVGIGLLLDDDRMEGHNYHNHRRIADMLEVAEPDLIVTDGIEMALGGNQMTERGHPLGALVMARNCVAHDATLARILGLNPEGIEHLRIASERGYGPLWADEIELGGDVKVGELASRVRSFGDTGFMPVTDFPKRFEREVRQPCPVEVIGAPPWDVAGSHGLVLDWLYMTYDFRERRRDMAEWPPLSIVCGGFGGDAAPPPSNERVFVIGDRAIEAWRALGWGGFGLTLPGFVRRLVRGPSRVERFTAPEGRKGWAWLVPGDPPTHRDVLLAIALGTGLRVRPPLVRLDLLLDSYVRSVATRLGRILRNLGGAASLEADAIPRLAARKRERAAHLEKRDSARARTVQLPRAPAAAAQPPPPTPSMVAIAAMDTRQDLAAPKVTAGTIAAVGAAMAEASLVDTRPDMAAVAPPPTPAMEAIAGMDTEVDLEVPTPADLEIVAARPTTKMPAVADPNEATQKLLRAVVAPSDAKPTDPFEVTGVVLLPAAREAISPGAAKAADPFEATGRVEAAAVEAARAAKETQEAKAVLAPPAPEPPAPAPAPEPPAPEPPAPAPPALTAPDTAPEPPAAPPAPAPAPAADPASETTRLTTGDVEKAILATQGPGALEALPPAKSGKGKARGKSKTKGAAKAKRKR